MVKSNRPRRSGRLFSSIRRGRHCKWDIANGPTQNAATNGKSRKPEARRGFLNSVGVRRGVNAGRSDGLSLRAASACGRACGPDEWLPPSGGRAFRTAFHKHRGVSVHERCLRAASFSSAPEAPGQRYCHVQRLAQLIVLLSIPKVGPRTDGCGCNMPPPSSQGGNRILR